MSRGRRESLSGKNNLAQEGINWQEPKLLVLVGLPGSGKSTWARQMAKEHGCQVVSSDEVRLELWGELQGVQSREKHEEVFSLVHQRLLRALLESRVAVADATNIYGHARDSLYQLAREAGVSAEVVFFTDHKEALRRNSLRSDANRVPEEAMERMMGEMHKVSFLPGMPVHRMNEARYLPGHSSG